MYSQSVNLIPQEEVHEQVKEQVVKMSTVFSVLLFLIVGGISFYFYNTVNSLKSDIKKTDSEIESFRKEISSMANVEISARNLSTKYNILKDLMKSREKYSILLANLKEKTPSTIVVANMTDSANNSLAISGTGETYTSIADFANSLTDGETVFSNVSLNSVSYENKSSRVSYSIVVTYIPEKLR